MTTPLAVLVTPRGLTPDKEAQLVATIPYGYCQCGCGEKTSLARRSVASLGHVKGEPVRYLVGHGTRQRDDHYKIQDQGYETPCWVWQRTYQSGYGATCSKSAHRYYYEKYVGLIPPEYVIHHKCNVRACVNPAHLQALTSTENTRLRPTSKINIETARKIRHMSSSENMRRKDIAASLALPIHLVHKVLSGHTWRED